MIRDIQDEIMRLKKENDVCILAHLYQNDAILEVADYTGDSFALAKLAQTVPNKTVLMCGVRFMAETCKILSPEKPFGWLTPWQAAPWPSSWICPHCGSSSASTPAMQW